ncbi:NAD(P)-dependent dehydrogenase, short-chain alcohol dehydrogenase family [Fontimonas thermophila]|uniref:NAD(P)-dependent dehydrogenase, short-chain alcohol dehydrogenase family n=1 Tax=Fontimonas thermophila TaxID=1076937 RepID=A0A1I2KBG5_9GAMM|nr:SDR family NAD(P)-dependent oxidoreductase [Fontimonas thermophila]SFF64432.1 NAD(P)-dependent dehydrogenase, short-chain alcohol dehydrogenase family [Fontimonas thermophila]
MNATLARDLAGKVAVVTGASRGAGKGIAIALGAHGATVYVTGRSLKEGDAPLPGTIAATAEAVTNAGGKGIAVACDHANDADVKALFERVEAEQNRLDILVNNATFLHDRLIDKGGFWEKPLELVHILDVGLRSAYVASWYAAPLMVRQKNGLIVFTSSFGANCYMHGPAYGAQKAGVDKFAKDMGVDLKPHNVAAVSIWMGMLRTERTRRVMDRAPDKYAGFWEIAETPQFTGHLIAALYNDPARAEKSGQVHIGAELAEVYGLTDEGRKVPSHRAMLGGPTPPHPAIVE